MSSMGQKSRLTAGIFCGQRLFFYLRQTGTEPAGILRLVCFRWRVNEHRLCHTVPRDLIAQRPSEIIRRGTIMRPSTICAGTSNEMTCTRSQSILS